MSNINSNCAWHFGLALLLGAVGVPASVVSADDPPAAKTESAKLAIEIRQLVEELQTIRGEQSALATRHREQVDRIDRQVQLLTDQFAAAEEAVTDERTQIAALEKSLSADRETIRLSNAWVDKIATAAVPVAESAAQRSSSSSTDALSSAELAFAGIGKRLSDQTSKERAASVGELCRLFGEQWLPARSVSLASEQVALDGGKRAVHAWVYRVGLASAAFASEDGNTVGATSGNPGLNNAGLDNAGYWSVQLPDAAQAQIRQLIDVAREQKPPAILLVPIRSSPKTVDGE
jgi:hypothetical protein